MAIHSGCVLASTCDLCSNPFSWQQLRSQHGAVITVIQTGLLNLRVEVPALSNDEDPAEGTQSPRMKIYPILPWAVSLWHKRAGVNNIWWTSDLEWTCLECHHGQSLTYQEQPTHMNFNWNIINWNMIYKNRLDSLTDLDWGRQPLESFSTRNTTAKSC